MEATYRRRDDKWLEAPGFCVECDVGKPLNIAGVCDDCWSAGRNAEYTEWEEVRKSGIEKQDNTREGMKSFIFVTTEGFTYQPGSESDIPDVENLQVLGLVSGQDERDAFQNVVREDARVLETSFRELKCYELRWPDHEQHALRFDLSDVRSRTK